MTDHDDERPNIRRLTRRETLIMMGGATLFVAVGCGGDDDASKASATNTPAGSRTATATPGASTSATTPAATQAATQTATVAPISCVITPALTEGPYFVDERLNRSDIRDDRQGVPLTITLAVTEFISGNRGDACTPIMGAIVDMWHCDGLGVYSDVQGNTETFLRGYQLTDSNGQAKFQTIFPGWYQGRAIHIHFKVRTDPDPASGHEFTSQLFFDDSTIDTVLQTSPYNGKGSPDVRNSADGIYVSEILIPLTGDPTNGYTGSYSVGVDFT